MSYSPLIHLIFLIPLLHLSSAHTTTLSISPSTPSPPHTTPHQRLRHLAAASLARAHHLKHPNTTTTHTVQSPLFPQSYGGYTTPLSLGTPPQTLPFIVDTASSLVWFPCTQNYTCGSCGGGPTTTAFIPELSSSTSMVGCQSPECRWLFPNYTCPIHDGEFCPGYELGYGSGSTLGFLITETLVFPDAKPLPNFVVGCSVFSTGAPAGIAGFGRGPESLPSQMKVTSFSYCMVSYQFEGTPVGSELVLVNGGGGSGGGGGGGISYTPFRKLTESSNAAYFEYYYVTVRKITVGGVDVRVPYEFLVPDAAGHGGTIVDSGTTFTFMENQIFKLVAEELEKQVGHNYYRAPELEELLGLSPCYGVFGDLSYLPQLTLHFKWGSKLELPLGNYFSYVDNTVVCLTITTNNGSNRTVGPGPAMILGNYQQQNIYMEYDLENERLGFRKQLCR